jgi:ketosteroid isomerase-like protein
MRLLFCLFAFVLCMSSLLCAQDAPPPEPAPGAAVEASKAADMEAELDQFRQELYTAFNEGRYEEMLTKYCHPEVVATWQDGSVSHGHAEVLEEFKKLSEFIDKIEVDPTVEKRVVLDGGKMVISTGKMKDQYKLKRGETVSLESHWSGTMVRENDKWMLVSFSGVANSFDNSVIRLYVGESMNRMMLMAAAGALIFGFVGGFWIGRKK